MNLQKYYDVLDIKDPNNMSEIETQRWTKLMNLSPTARGYICKAKEQGYDVIDCYSKEELFKRYDMQFRFESLVEHLKLQPIKIKRGENLYVQYLDLDNLKKLDEFMSQPKDVIKRIARETTCLKKYGFKSPNQSPKIRQQIAESVKKTWTEDHRKQVSGSVKRSWDNKSLEEREQIRQNVIKGMKNCNQIHWTKRGKEDVQKIKKKISEGRKKYYRDCLDKRKIAHIIDGTPSSEDEQKLKLFIENDLGLSVVKNHRTLIKTDQGNIREIDIYIPEKNVAIEYNGIYFHSSKFTYKDYHLEKTQACENLGIRLIHVFSHQYSNKKPIIESIIRLAVGKPLQKIYARDCIVQELDSKFYKDFLEINHIQGPVGSSTRLGLFYKGELVQVVGIGKSRFKKDEVELQRMCTKLNTQVLGGFSKLMKHSPFDVVISYVDRSLYNAQSYQSTKWTKIGESKPGYIYYKNNKVYSRQTFQKHKLKNILENFDPNLTEVENVTNNGYLQLFDCGTLKFQWTR